MRKIRKLFKLLPPLLLRDIKERYAGSVFGVFWTFFQPLFFVLLYWIVFSQIMKIRIQSDAGDVPFFAFLLSGLLPWFAFQEGIIRGASSIVDKRHVIKKVIFPAELFPLSSVMTAFIHHGIGLFFFLGAFFIWKGGISLLQFFSIICLLVLQIVLTSGLSLLISALSVYIRDIIQIIGVAFQVIFYLSTILYPITSVPETLKGVILLNPVTPLIEAYHSVILYGKYPGTWGTFYLFSFTIVAAVSGVLIFRKLKRGFADVL
jgi:lipopolysaccharide transport system permease protein